MDVLLTLHGAVWGIPMLLMILFVGIRIMICTEFVQFRMFPGAMKELYRRFLGREDGSGTSAYRALCTALGATVGTGNIVGVAGAICLGGPGAVFWMWICGIIAMGTKYAEATLAVRYRVGSGVNAIGGPMYMILNGMDRRWHGLAAAYSFLGAAACFGVGNAAQVNAVISGLKAVLPAAGASASWRFELAMGLILAVVVGSVLLVGMHRIGAAAEVLVPVASILYIGLCLLVLILRWDRIGQAVSQILRGAFAPEAVTGGAVGSWFQVLRTGCARGTFTNEAGMGTASIAHGSADVSHPAEQGLLGIAEVFLDTIVICTLTALVILVSDISIPYCADPGAVLTNEVLCSICGNWVSAALAACLFCFGIAAIFGWSLYGTRCAQFLWGQDIWEPFAAAQTLAVVMGAVMKTETVWLVSELLNGLMAIPNLIVLAVLIPELSRLTNEYKNKTGGTIRRRR